jgi:hypothetical protein
MRMQQPILADYLGPRIAEDNELVADLFVPNQMGMFLIVDADGYQPCFGLFEFVTVLRELAQLANAERSPVAAIENQDDTGPT